MLVQMKHAIFILIVAVLIIKKKLCVGASEELNENYWDIIKNSNDIEDIKNLIKNLNDLKERINESEEIESLLRQNFVHKIDKILFKFKNYFDGDTELEDVQISGIASLEKLNDVTFIFDYYKNFNQSEQNLAQGSIISLINFLDNDYLKNLKVFIVIPEFIEYVLETKIVAKLRNNVKIFRFNKNGPKYWTIFNYLLNQVETSYIFFGDRYEPPHLSFTQNKDSTLETFIKSFSKLVDILNSNKKANAIAAGLIRNKNQEIIEICAKSTMKYYSLKYELHNIDLSDSFNEYLNCEYIYKGNFLASKNHLISISNTFQYFDSDYLFFNYLFLQLKLKYHKILLHPSVIFDIATRENYAKNKSFEIFSNKFISEDFNFFMQKNEIELITVYDESKHLLFKYKVDDCKILKLSCTKSSLSKFYSLPRCCRQILTTFLKHFEVECKKKNVLFELDSGTLLGAIKFSSTLPWEIDGDITYFSENHENLRQVLDTLYNKYGYYYGFESLPVNNTRGEFHVYVKPFWVELYGLGRSYFTDTLNSTIGQTKIKVDGSWLSCPVSPGLWVRNRYGVNLFKHALSWRYLGLQHSFQTYSSKINSGYCPEVGLHSCISALGNDGNYQYGN